MSTPDATGESPRPDLTPVVRYYLFAGSISLMVLWLALFERGFELFSLIPVLLGALGLAPSLFPPGWRGVRVLRKLPLPVLPLFLVIALVPMEIVFSPGRIQQSDFFRLSDLLLAIGLLGYLMAQYRLIGMRAGLVPVDERPRADRLGGDDPEARAAEQTQPGEWKNLIWLVPVCVVAGQLSWQWLLSSERWNVFGTEVPRLAIERVWWRMYVLVWILSICGLLLAGAGAILRLYRLTRIEADMTAQESLWDETRGEQRRLHRWLAWLRRKRARETRSTP